MNKYFDVNDFSDNPVKSVVKPFIYSLGGNYVQPYQFVDIRNNIIQLYETALIGSWSISL